MRCTTVSIKNTKYILKNGNIKQCCWDCRDSGASKGVVIIYLQMYILSYIYLFFRQTINLIKQCAYNIKHNDFNWQKNNYFKKNTIKKEPPDQINYDKRKLYK